MAYDSYVQLPEGKYMENLEGHKHSIANNLISLQEMKRTPGGQQELKNPGPTQNRLLLSCSTLAWHMGFLWSCRSRFPIPQTAGFSRWDNHKFPRQIEGTWT